MRRVERQIREVELLPHDAGDDELRPTGAVVGGTRYLLDDDAFNTAWRGDVPAVQKYSFALRLGQPQRIVRIDLRIGVRRAGTVEWLAFSRPTSIHVYAGAGDARSPDQRVTWYLDPDDDHWQRLRWHFPVQTDLIQFYVQDATQCPFPGATISGLRVYGTAGNRVEPRELAKVRDWVDGNTGGLVTRAWPPLATRAAAGAAPTHRSLRRDRRRQPWQPPLRRQRPPRRRR